MAERPAGRRRSRRDSIETASSLRVTPPSSKDRRTKRSSKPSKERWLLTRKTWRYMADAGRRLIPDGTHNRPEDIPKIEQYFQEVCQKEPRFLLWRKASYPGTLGFRSQRRRRHVKGGSCRTKASSADEADDARSPAQGFVLQTTTSGKFDLAKVKREWLLASGSGSTPSSPVTQRKSDQEDAEAKALADMLQKYLNMQTESTRTTGKSEIHSQIEGKEPFDYKSLISKLQQHLDFMVRQSKLEHVPIQRTTMEKDNVPKSMQPYQGDYVHKSLLETISRYYSKSATREHVISDILTDRKLLEKLYFDLRCTRGFRGPRATGAYTSPSSSWWTHQRSRIPMKESDDWLSNKRDFVSPPPLIAVQQPSIDRGPVDDGIQTDPVPREVLEAVLAEREREEASKETSVHKSSRRRSSVDNDDVSPSVSDTIKRYLRMARKKSMDADKVDRFKRVNYDRNLRNIKAKGEITKPGDDDGNSKGCQTDDNWAVNYREMSSMENPFENLSDADTTTSPPSRNASSRSSIDAGLGSEEPLTPKHHHHQSFLSHLLHGSNAHKDKPHSAPGSPALTTSSANSAGGTTMQKSKSSSSVVHPRSRLVTKKMSKPRSKSTSRASNQPCAWSCEGNCTWICTDKRRVDIQDTPLRLLSKLERKGLRDIAVAKLRALNLGVPITPPIDTTITGTAAPKPRVSYLDKGKALTTSIFDIKKKEDKDKDASEHLVFQIPLLQCLENDKISNNSRHGSRIDCNNLSEPTVSGKTNEGGSYESLSSKGGDCESSCGGEQPPGEWEYVPVIVRECIKYLENNALRVSGIFRVSPAWKRFNSLKKDFDSGNKTEIDRNQGPHEVAALLKDFLRDLPDPLLCKDLHEAFIHTQKLDGPEAQVEAIRYLIQLLPTPNRETLRVLLNLLSKIAQNSGEKKPKAENSNSGNQMDTENLAIVLAPSIFPCKNSEKWAEEKDAVINVVITLLKHASTLFTVPATILDELYKNMTTTHPEELDTVLSQLQKKQSGEKVVSGNVVETSVEETLTTSTTTAGTTTASSRQLWTREQCLHQAAWVGGDIGPRARRSKRSGSRRKDEERSNSVDSGSSEDPSNSRRRSSPGETSCDVVVTASFTIPFTFNNDIPYIEEAARPSAPPRRQRQRSISGCSEGPHGSDSAVGSSASWASSSPASPDSTVTAVSYISDEPPVLQRVSFTTSSEVCQVTRTATPETQRTIAPPDTTSITSIGGAVLRSKTADIERMLRISRSEANVTVAQSKSSTTSDSKKYTKRRYTDSRHQTRHIPDSDTLTGKTTMTVTSTSSVTMSSSSVSSTQNLRARGQPVWKRRELISSAPKDREGYF